MFQMSEMRDTFAIGGKDSARPSENPCTDGKQAVLECYRNNAKSPMICAQHVQAFADCVDKHRISLVSNNKG